MAMMNIKDARKIIKDLSEKPFVCSKHCIETESGYVITTKEKQKYVRSKKWTNADRIRNMTDEELAEFLDKSLNQDREDCDPLGCYGCAYYGTHHQDKNSELYECRDCEFENGILEWLQAEAKDGDT